MEFEVKVEASIFVSVEFGDVEHAKRLVRDHVANDWILRSISGAKMPIGLYSVKGLSATIREVAPFKGNPVVEAFRREEVKD
jgi:hypothetical protein